MTRRQNINRFPFSWILVLAALGFATVPPADAANSNSPVIENVSSVLYSGILYVSGYVRDDGDVTRAKVYFSGDVTGSATVGQDGRFWFRAAFYYPYGSATVRATDKDNIKSDPVNFEFHE